MIYRGSHPAVETLTNHGTILIQGGNAQGNAQLSVTDLLTNTGTIEIQSTDGNWFSGLTAATGQIVNRTTGQIVVNLGSGGGRTISGTLVNQGQVIVDPSTALDITGTYQAAGGTITGPGYLVNCTLQETASPASPSIIVVSGGSTTLGSDNHAGYTIWVQGSNHDGDTILKLAGNENNFGAILLKSTDGAWRSDINTGAFILTNAGSLTSSLGTGGERAITGNVTNTGSIVVDAGTWLNSTQTGNTFNQNAGTINAAGTFTVTSGRFNFNGGTATGDVGVYNGQLAVANTVTQTATIGAFGGSSVLVNNLSPVVTVWVQGRSMFGDAILNLSSAATNAGAILLKSTDGAWRSDINTGAFILTNAGSLTSSLGTGGERAITGNVTNTGSIVVDAGTWLNSTQTGNTFNQNAGTINAAGTFTVTSGRFNFNGGTATGDVGVYNGQLAVANTVTQTATIGAFGGSSVLVNNLSPVVTVWVQGRSMFGDAILNLSSARPRTRVRSC